MIFSIAYSGRIWHEPSGKQIIALSSFMIAVLLMAVLDNSAAGWLNASDALVAVGLGTALFVMVVNRRLDINLAFSILLIYLVGYGFLRSWVFASHLKIISIQAKPMYESYLNRFPTLKLNKNMLVTLQNILLTYQSAIWGSMQISAAFFGMLLFNKISTFKHPLRFMKYPFQIVYILISALLLYLNQATRIWGVNLLICMGMIYLIQGAAVMSFVWGDFFSRARFMRSLLIMAIIINYPVMVLISFAGVLDVWFDFRKITIKEEKT